MMLMGWTVEQWAIAKSRYTRVKKRVVSSNLAGASQLRRAFFEMGWPEPATGVLYGVEPEKDWNWAFETMRVASMQCLR